MSDKVVESKKRLEMLTTYRDKLLALEAKPDGDIDSIVKIASELAKVQNELEYALGKQQKLVQRVNNDILSVTLTSPYHYSFWDPIDHSLSDFRENFAEGIASFISFSAYLIPWSLFLLLSFLFFRTAWRFVRRK